MAEELLAGSNSTPAASGSSDFVYCGLFQAIKSATGVTKFYLYAAGSGNVKVAVYSNNTGLPDARLTYNNSGQAVTSGWNVLTISSVNITASTYYFLCAISDTASVIGRDTSGGTSVYGGKTYSTWSWLDPIGTGISTSNSYLYAMYLYGETGGSGGFLNRNYWWFQ